MDVAYGLTGLAAFKLVTYSFGSLIHLFLIVLILVNWRLRRFQILLFALMAALFMWYAGNLLSLNVSLFYGAGPRLLTGFASTISLLGFMAAVPLLVHAQTEYCSAFLPVRFWQRLIAASFYVPAIFWPWLEGSLLSHPGLEPLVAIGQPMRALIIWASAALLYAASVNFALDLRRRSSDPVLAWFHAYLAGLQGLLAVGILIAYLPQRQPPVGGLGGFFATGLMLLGVLPSALVGYSITRYNFLDLRVQPSVLYSVAAIFGFLIYLNFMRRASGWLEGHELLPAAVTEGVMIFALVVLVEPLKRLIGRSLRQQFVSQFERVQKLAAEIEECAKRTGDAEAIRLLVEERVPREIELEGARLNWGTVMNDALRRAPLGTHFVPISRGQGTVAYLEVVSAGSGVSGSRRPPSRCSPGASRQRSNYAG